MPPHPVPFVPPSVISDDDGDSARGPPPLTPAIAEMRRREFQANQEYQWQVGEMAQVERRRQEEMAYMRQMATQGGREELRPDGQPRVPFIPPSVISGDDEEGEEREREAPRERVDRQRQQRERSAERQIERDRIRAATVERERQKDRQREQEEEMAERQAQEHNNRLQRRNSRLRQEGRPNWEDEEAPQQQFVQERRREDSQNKVYELKAYRWRPSRNHWKHASTHSTSGKPAPSSVRIITWNVDFMNRFPHDRMAAALAHIRRDVLRLKDIVESPPPCCILLQEVRYSVIDVVLSDEWVKRHFMVTPLSIEKWPADAKYGNMTLVARSLSVVRAQIIHFAPGTHTMMHRTGVAVNIRLRAPEPNPRNVVVCIVNTHLESLPVGEPLRPKQMALLTRFLNDKDVIGGIIAGDMNAIGYTDKDLPDEVGLKDAWKKSNWAEEGFTWGYQPPSVGPGENLPPARLDKVLFLPGKGYKIEEPRIIGVGVKEEDEREFVSDHYGLETTLRMTR